MSRSGNTACVVLLQYYDCPYANIFVFHLAVSCPPLISLFSIYLTPYIFTPCTIITFLPFFLLHPLHLPLPCLFILLPLSSYSPFFLPLSHFSTSPSFLPLPSLSPSPSLNSSSPLLSPFFLLPLSFTPLSPIIVQQYLCKFSEETIGTECTGMVRIRHGNELELKKAVAVVGPVTVAVDSRHTSFQVCHNTCLAS